MSMPQPPASIHAKGLGRSAVALGAAALCLLLGAAPATAQSSLFPTFTARLGGYVLDTSTKVRLDTETRLGNDVDFEDDFGLDENVTQGSVNLELQASHRNLFRLGYYKVDHSGERRIDRSFTLGGVVFPAGAQVSANVTTTVYEADWTFWFVRGDRGALGGTLGASLLDIDTSADARLQIGSVVQTRHEDASATAPIPSIGLEGRGAIGPYFVMLGYARFLPDVTVGDVTGSALQFMGGLEWVPLQHAGIGVAYKGFGFDGEVDSTRYDGGLDLTFQGWQLYARFSS